MMANSSHISPAIPLSNSQPHNGSSTPSTPATYQSQQPMRQPQTRYSNMFDRVENARRQTGSAAYDFYTDEDVLNESPRGWPSLVTTKMYYPNHNSYRAFGPSTHTVLTSLEQKIDCIGNILDEMAFEDSGTEGKPLGSLPFNREQFIDRCIQGIGHLPTQPPGSDTSKLDRATQRDNLIIVQEILLEKYCELPTQSPFSTHQRAATIAGTELTRNMLSVTLLHRLYDNKKFSRVSQRAHERSFEFARGYQGLNDESLAFMRYIDDFVYPDPDCVFRRFEYLLHTKAHWVTLPLFPLFAR
ncbi:hypothetical protein M434DRAFT_383303 [Hypoxylon sp. CO27-5]|nr:hypothetical protein M434DRAFT_383303 [Hypoxylon sp. CO27-5]